jgi:hypothetical protein
MVAEPWCTGQLATGMKHEQTCQIECLHTAIPFKLHLVSSVQVAKKLTAHGPMKISRRHSGNLSLHEKLKAALSVSLRHEKLKKILIVAHESRKWGNNST